MGKGSHRRQGANDKAYADGWERTFGSPYGRSLMEDEIADAQVRAKAMTDYLDAVTKKLNERDTPNRSEE